MRISKNEELGLRLVASLAREGGQLSIRELADGEGVPEATIAKVVARLRRAGLAEAERGRNGGYSLTRPPHRITLAEVLGAFDDRLFGSDYCTRMNGGARCVHDDGCGLRPVWQDLGAMIGSYLTGLTVADVVGGAAAAPEEPAGAARLPVLGGTAAAGRTARPRAQR